MKNPKEKEAVSLLHQQGFGSKKNCAKLIYKHLAFYSIALGSDKKMFMPIVEPSQPIPCENIFLKVEGLEIPVLPELYLAFHKPLNTECSHQPGNYPSVFSYFPAPFITRNLQAIGRLDTDTSGLLLLTTDGDFNHRLTSPKKHISKTYEVVLGTPITDEQIQVLTEGVLLKGETNSTLPAQIKETGDRKIQLTITEGRYHQVKRMLAAVGNKVLSLHRSAIGDFNVTDIPVGEWRILSKKEYLLLGVEPKR